MSPKRKILIIDATSRTLPYDYWYARALARHCDVDLLISEHCANTEYLEYLRIVPGVQLLFTRMDNTRPLRSALRYILLMIRLVLFQGRYNTINIQWSIMPWLDVLLFPFLSRRLVVTLHNPVPHSYAGRRYPPFAWFSRIARRLVFVSEFSRREFLSRYRPLKPEKLAVLPHGAMPLLPEHASASASAGASASTSGPPVQSRELRFWGRVEAYKGVDFFLRLLKSPEGADLSLRIIGRWESSLKPLKVALQQGGADILDAYVDFSYVQAELDSGAVFVLPYKAASQSGVFYNLLFHKVPFVATDVGDIGNVVREMGHPDILFNVDSTESFARAHRYAVENAAGIRADVERLVAKRFSWNYTPDELSAAFALA